MTRRPILAGIAIAALLVAVTLPALAAGPSASPGQSGKPEKPAKAAEAAEVAITLHGTISLATDAKSKETYTLADGGKTYTLEAGPAWFFGDSYPLKPFVGQSVTIVGEVDQGGTEVDVESVNGTALRAAGKPPWAGGWKVQGQKHPGWSQEKADKFKAKHGDCAAPGQCKDASGKPAKVHGPEASEGPDESEGPEASDAPEAPESPDASEAPEASPEPLGTGASS